MFKHILKKLEKEVSGDVAFNFASEISRHHRIQASPGMRAAVNYAVETLKRCGLEAEVKEYPADGKTYYWSSLQFKEWSCRDAELRLTQPSDEACILARWSESKLSLIQRSYPTIGGCCEAELVVLEKGEEENDYESVDVEGKIVVTNGDVRRVYELAVESRGAIGILFDGTWVRPPALLEGELDDALRYTSFWWAGDERPCFGFVLTPRRGRWLRQLVEKQSRKKESVKVWAKVDSQLYSGSIENAVATITGKTDEEILVVAHICHPQPSVNDNASGCAAAMEAARSLLKLYAQGVLPKPKRTIRFILLPEMTGTYAYLAGNEEKIPNMVAAINLDMVGEKQEVCGGPLIVEKTPEATSSFVNALMEAILDEIKHEAGNLGGSSKYALFKHVVTPFSGGSDHYIYSDPTVGIPSPMIIQWPDKFWHTSYDTLDKVDPEMLRKVSLMTATYVHFIANADIEEAIWLVSEVAARQKRELIDEIHSQVTTTLNAVTESKESKKKLAEAITKLRKKVSYRLSRCIESVRSVKRLIGETNHFEGLEKKLISELEATAKNERKLAERILADYAKMKGIDPLPRFRRGRLKKSEKRAAEIVPHRVFKGPVSTRPWLRKLSKEDREAWWKIEKERDKQILGTLAMYWVDGKSSLLDISRLVESEIGRTDLEYLVNYFDLLRKMKLVEYI